MFTGPPAFPGRATPSRGQQVFTNHETRDTAFVVARHGRRLSPAPATRVYAFHESRDTRHESRLLCFSSHDCPALPTIARHCPLKKCCKPWWPRNPAVDLAALDVSRAPLRDSPAVRLSQRIMNQGLSCRAAQASANSEVFTKHETRPFLARRASQREIQGFHEKLKTKN